MNTKVPGWAAPFMDNEITREQQYRECQEGEGNGLQRNGNVNTFSGLAVYQWNQEGQIRAVK